MDVFFSWVAAALGGLFAVAVLVAWWEHLARQARPTSHPPLSSTPRAVKIDVPLDTAHGVLLPLSDTEQRRTALGGAMERMGRVGQAARAEGKAAGEGWVKTSPMALQPEEEESTRPTRRHG